MEPTQRCLCCGSETGRGLQSPTRVTIRPACPGWGVRLLVLHSASPHQLGRLATLSWNPGVPPPPHFLHCDFVSVIQPICFLSCEMLIRVR